MLGKDQKTFLYKERAQLSVPSGCGAWERMARLQMLKNHHDEMLLIHSIHKEQERMLPEILSSIELQLSEWEETPSILVPGVTYSKLINSEVKGKSSRVGIYLDAESAYNTFENNYIHVETKEDNWGKIPGVTGRGWPQMAIDGSSRNTIHNNRFSSLSNGGIYLYRNCGEGGTIRLTPPENNTITNNTFYYKKYKGSKPAIYLGSRDYGRKESTFGHCNDDSGRPYGSSSSNKDYARHNIIKNNKLHKRMIVPLGGFGLVDARVEDMIVTKNKSANSPNEISGNTLYE